MTKWEYFSGSLVLKNNREWIGKIHGENVAGIDQYCNFYGQDGWELVSANYVGGFINSMIVVFKRPKDENRSLGG